MASIQKRGRNSFLLVVELGYDGRGKRIRRTKTVRVEDESLLRTKKRLEDHLKMELYKFQAEVESGEYIAVTSLKFKGFVDDWYDKHAMKNLAIRTRNNYMEKLKNYILPHFGNYKIEDIKTMHIVMFLDEISQPGMAASGRKEPLSSATIYEIDKTMRVIFNKAVEWQVLKESPMEKLSRPSIKKRKMNFLDNFGIQHFLESMDQEDPVWRMFFITSAISGYRRGEVVALKWTNVNFDEGYLKIDESIPFFEGGEPYVKGTKTEEDERLTYMPEWYMNELMNFKEFWDLERYAVGDKWLGGNDEYLFHDGFGIPFLPSSVTGKWIKVRKKYGIDNIRLHDLRHTMISYLLNEEIPIFAVSKRAGHSSIKITSDTYGHSDNKTGKTAVKPLEKLKPKQSVNNWSTSDIVVEVKNK